MKKLIVFLTLLIILVMAPTVLAAQKTEVPAKLVQESYWGDHYPVTINLFEVTNVTKVADKRIGIDYRVAFTDPTEYGRYYTKANFYNDMGILVESTYFDLYSRHMEAPIDTATIELTVENPAEGCDSYLYRKFVNVYAPGGRSLRITDLQVPIYESVGWSGPVTMYAPSGSGLKTLEISPYEIAAYEAVGWYTYEGITFKQFRDNYYNKQKPAGDYNAVFDSAEAALDILAGTKYEKQIYAIRAEAMDLWRVYRQEPIGIIGYSIYKPSVIGTDIIIEVRNLSYKKIRSFALKFDCYDKSGKYTSTNYNVYYTNVANLDLTEKSKITWRVDGVRNDGSSINVNTIKNIRVVEVTYEDGTKWKK